MVDRSAQTLYMRRGSVRLCLFVHPSGKHTRDLVGLAEAKHTPPLQRSDAVPVTLFKYHSTLFPITRGITLKRALAFAIPANRWRTHKWHPCTLVPDAVRQGITGPGEACGKGLEVRGKGKRTALVAVNIRLRL